jgi:CRP-like cAMP-binding protein
MTSALASDVTARLPEIRAQSFDRVPDNPGILNVLSAEQQAMLRSIASVQPYRLRNELIFSEGSEATFIYLVASGLVRVSRCAESGRRQVLAFMMPGDIFGFPEQGLHVNTARSMGNVMLYRMNWWRLNELMRREPSLQTSLFMRMVFDLRQAQKHIILLGQQNITQRLASFFLDLMRHDEFYSEAQKELTLPLSRFDLAEFLGTRPETVVRAMARMEAKGLIRRNSLRLLTIADPEGLVALLSEARRCN